MKTRFCTSGCGEICLFPHALAGIQATNYFYSYSSSASPLESRESQTKAVRHRRRDFHRRHRPAHRWKIGWVSDAERPAIPEPVGKRGELVMPQDAEVIDAEGKSIPPRFESDGHCHYRDWMGEVYFATAS